MMINQNSKRPPGSTPPPEQSAKLAHRWAGWLLGIGVALFWHGYTPAQEASIKEKIRAAVVQQSATQMAYEAGFQARALQIVKITADHYQPPSLDIGDPEKYWWPKIMSRLMLYGNQDTAAAKYIPFFSKRAPFHFVLVGTSRMLYDHADVPAMKQHRLAFLQSMWRRKDSYNAWTCEGTENHINMSRTSGYLFAQAALEYPKQFPDAPSRMAQMKNWMQQWSKKLYEVGNGEWNTGIYEAYHVVGWLNVYDFAKDPEVKAIARAVLDYYSAEMALHYSYGVLGGAEMRGNGVGHNHANSASWLGWLWFGVPETRSLDHAKGSEYIQNMHAVASTYRPPAALVKLAQKQQDSTQYYIGSRPEYLLSEGSFSKHWLYLGKTYTLGTAAVPYGGFMGGTMQLIPWKMVARNQNPDSLPLSVGGNGGFFNIWDGRTRNPFTQVAQHKNILVQLTKTPKNVEQIATQVNQLAKQWDLKWRADFNKRFPNEKAKERVIKPGKPQLFDNLSYLCFPRGTKFGSRILPGNKFLYFTQVGEAYVLFYPFTGKAVVMTASDNLEIVIDKAPLGQTCGFLVKVLSTADFPTLAQAVADEFKHTLAINQEASKVSYIQNQQMWQVQYADSGKFQEPLVDWGFGADAPMSLITAPPFTQPAWPSGAGAGKMPRTWLDGKADDLHAKNWPICQGPELKIAASKMKVSVKDLNYEVDYSGRVPIFR